jgi:hypothetical protein
MIEICCSYGWVYQVSREHLEASSLYPYRNLIVDTSGSLLFNINTIFEISEAIAYVLKEAS